MGLFSLAIFSNTTTKSSSDNNLNSNKDFCRVTCTVSVPDGFGGSIGISATAGNFLTGCKKARERACKKAARKSMSAIMDNS
ncbi:hypothetical protein [Tenacibaculum jejuense]|uniref:hypothetical protein n=1 Tax=Tenacibaculum jejuense TaxID=584609 RepID=UPI0012FDFF7F|nr:hypothetical protein [Tenacibaculum jejuense]